MSQPAMRVFSTELKEGVVLRLEAGERIAAVADELKIKRKLLYEWRAAYRTMGASGLNRKRGPKPRDLAARASSDAAPAPDASSELARAKAGIRRVGAQDRQTADGPRFFSRSLAAHRRVGGRGGQDQRDVLYAVIETMSGAENGQEIGDETQGCPSIDHLCALANVSRAGFYRFGEVRQPERAEADLHDKIQTIALKNRFYGYRKSARNSQQAHQLAE